MSKATGEIIETPTGELHYKAVIKVDEKIVGEQFFDSRVRAEIFIVETLKWPRSFEQNFRVVKWIVGRGLCCRAERQRVRVGLIRGAAVKGCVRSPCVVEGDVAAD